MTYVRKTKVFKVTFEEGHAFGGLTMTTRVLKIAEYAEFGIRLSTVTGGVVVGATIEAQQAHLEHLKAAIADAQELFADVLIEWDMQEEDGTPTPATLDGIRLLEDSEFMSLLNGWLSAIGGSAVADSGDGLGKDSGSGETSPELSALMEPLSPSQAS